MDVKTTLCAYWALINERELYISMAKLSSQDQVATFTNFSDIFPGLLRGKYFLNVCPLSVYNNHEDYYILGI